MADSATDSSLEESSNSETSFQLTYVPPTKSVPSRSANSVSCVPPTKKLRGERCSMQAPELEEKSTQETSDTESFSRTSFGLTFLPLSSKYSKPAKPSSTKSAKRRGGKSDVSLVQTPSFLASGSSFKRELETTKSVSSKRPKMNPTVLNEETNMTKKVSRVCVNDIEILHAGSIIIPCASYNSFRISYITFLFLGHQDSNQAQHPR